MTRRTLAFLAGALVLLAAPLAAQTVDTVPEPRDAAKLALVRELMTVANFRGQLLRTMRESSTRQGAMVPVPPGFWEIFLARAEQDADTLLAPMAEDYARYFSSSDLRALIAFYKSSAGQRLSLVAPVISANSAFTGSQWGSKVGMQIATEMVTPPVAPDSAKSAPVKMAPVKKP